MSGPRSRTREAARLSQLPRERTIAASATGFLVATLMSFPGSSLAQEPTAIRSLLTGYGAVGFDSTREADERNENFTGLLALTPLARIHEDVFVEGEVKFELEHESTEVVLEHIEVHYQGFERLQLKAGKFHLPIGVWSHANWTNKMPTPPLLYEDTHGHAAENALMPIPFDLGAMATYTFPSPTGWRTSGSFWISQGPTGTFEGGHDHGDTEPGPDEEHGSDAPLLELGGNFEDNNRDKMLGLSLRAASAAGLTVQGTGFHAAYDEAGDLTVSGVNLGVVWSPGALFEFKGEGMVIRQEFIDHHDALDSVNLSGYYFQLGKRYGDWEPVARWSHLPRTEAGHETHTERRRQMAVGLNYWLSPSTPLKLGYQWEVDDRSNGLFFEWAAGF